MRGGFYHYPLLPVTTALASLCGFILIYLTIQVIRLRWRHRKAVGAIKTDTYERRHGALVNFTSNMPLVLILFALAELHRVNCGLLFFFAGFYLVARISHIYSVYKYETATKRYTLRAFGMMGTFGVIIALALLNLYIVFSH
jgi:uncharacterized membrane protein YecN with MAPEG domain